MKKHILILTLILSTQILFARYVGLPDSFDIERKCKKYYEVKVCLKAIKAIAHDRSMSLDARYYDAYKLSQKLCRIRKHKKEGRYACKLERYYHKKYMSVP